MKLSIVFLILLAAFAVFVAAKFAEQKRETQLIEDRDRTERAKIGLPLRSPSPAIGTTPEK
jgi:hypothetical protein